jgi:hypothetical protein
MRRALMVAGWIAALAIAPGLGCGSSSDAPASGGATGTGAVGGSSLGGSGGSATGGNGTGGAPVPPPVCDASAPSEDSSKSDYGLASLPPAMALADTFYSYDMRTNIGSCSTDQVEWSFEQGPPGAVLEVGATTVQPTETYVHTTGGAAREAAKVAWDLDGVAPGCYQMAVRWRAWLDCGITDPGAWGESVVQRWAVAVRDNVWHSGDLHVHTKHSERGEEAGSSWDYYTRMVNLTSNDAGESFADRRTRSLRGRLDWLIFSDHSNNEVDECGRVFVPWCENQAALESATGRDVVRQISEKVKDVLLVQGSEISNKWGGHFGFLPKNPFPNHPLYAPGYDADPTDYDFDVGFGTGIFPDRWVKAEATNQEEIDLMHQLGGLVIVNHEAALAPWVAYDWSSLDIDGVEVWNGGNRHDKYDDSAYHGGIDVNAVAENNLTETTMPEDPIEHSWLGLLKTGRWPTLLTGGSDVHDYNEVVCYQGPCDPTNAELGLPTTSVWAPDFVWTNGADGIFDGIARGRVVVHDHANFIDLRVVYQGLEYHVGDSISAYKPGDPLVLRAFGRTANFVDGDNRVVLMLGTNADATDRRVRVLYNSEDDSHFVQQLKGKDHMRYIRADSSFDREVETSLSAADLGSGKTYVVFAQFIPWHNPLYLWGNGQDMAETGAIRIVAP